MAGLSSYMLCLHPFPCEQAPRQKPTSTTFIPMGLCHDEKQKHKKIYLNSIGRQHLYHPLSETCTSHYMLFNPRSKNRKNVILTLLLNYSRIPHPYHHTDAPNLLKEKILKNFIIQWLKLSKSKNIKKLCVSTPFYLKNKLPDKSIHPQHSFLMGLCHDQKQKQK